ncbi:MAG: ABC transporter permease [Parvularculaceae bacterium]|nr:ABC transporter permease [Parvularculaceae bacterium]
MSMSVTINSPASQRGAGAMVRDLVEGALKTEVWSAFAWDETLARYRRSALGLAWIVLSYGFFVVVLAIFFGDFSSATTRDFLIYVALGFAVFSLLNGNLVDGCAVFVNSANWIKSASIPYSVFVYKSIFRSITPFFLELTVALATMTYLGWKPTIGALWAIPAFGAMLLFSVWVQYLLGLFAARWRDVTHLMGALSRTLFVVTPILWLYKDARPLVRSIADYNPFTHYVQIFRAPMLGDPVPVESWVFVGWFTLGGLLLTLAVGAAFRHRLPHWI